MNKDVGAYWIFERMDVACLQCGALHYMVDEVEHNTGGDLVLADPSNNGKVHAALNGDPPNYIRDQYTSREPQAMHSSSNKLSCNIAVSMASVAANCQERRPGVPDFNSKAAVKGRINQNTESSSHR